MMVVRFFRDRTAYRAYREIGVRKYPSATSV